MTMNMDQLRESFLQQFKQRILQSEKRIVDRLTRLIEGRQPLATLKNIEQEDFIQDKMGGSEGKESVPSNDFERSTVEWQAVNDRQRVYVTNKELGGPKGEILETDVLKAEAEVMQTLKGEQDFAVERQRVYVTNKEQGGLKGAMPEIDVLKAAAGVMQTLKGEQDVAVELKYMAYRQLFENG